jgi:hypothetical protein
LFLGSAAVLAQGVLTTMSTTRWWKLASLLLVAGATVSGAGMLAGNGTKVATDPQSTNKPVPGAELDVKGTKAVERNGNAGANAALGSSKNVQVRCHVEGGSTLISILPLDTKVKKGDLVAELDSASLRDQLTNQRITTQSAQAALQNARLTREVAEIAVTEYEQGIYVSDKSTIQGEIKLAESARQKAEARLERTRRAQKKLSENHGRKDSITTPSDILAELEIEDRIDTAEQALLQETISFEKAQNKLNMLNEYTKPKTIKELRTQLEKDRSNELMKGATWELEKNKEANLERQIAACTIHAPTDGVINSVMGEGSRVHEHQSIMEIHKSSQ